MTVEPTLLELAQQVGEALKRRRWTLAIAESCTGGLLGHLLTEIPGSTSYFLGGIVAYDNRIKQEILGVSSLLLAEHGAVSATVAQAMAEGARVRLGTTIAVATTGVAGPGGGTPDKPVGLVYLGLAMPDTSSSERWIWDSDRSGNKWLSARRALEMLLERL